MTILQLKKQQQIFSNKTVLWHFAVSREMFFAFLKSCIFALAVKKTNKASLSKYPTACTSALALQFKLLTDDCRGLLYYVSVTGRVRGTFTVSALRSHVTRRESFQYKPNCYYRVSTLLLYRF